MLLIEPGRRNAGIAPENALVPIHRHVLVHRSEKCPANPALLVSRRHRHPAKLPGRLLLPPADMKRHAANNSIPVKRADVQRVRLSIPLKDCLLARQPLPQHLVPKINNAIDRNRLNANGSTVGRRSL